MSVPDAQAAAKNALRDLRYDKDEYFWVHDQSYIMIMHGGKPETEGKSFEHPAPPALPAARVAYEQPIGFPASIA